MDKLSTVFLFYPNGSSQRYDVYQITHYDKNSISFSVHVFHGDEVAVTEYTSTLPYVIMENYSGPKNLV